MANVNEGLATEVTPGQEDKTPLRTVMQHIRSVNVSMDRRRATFEPIKRTLALLKSHGRPVDELMVDEHAEGDEKRVIDYLGSPNQVQRHDRPRLRQEGGRVPDADRGNQEC